MLKSSSLIKIAADYYYYFAPRQNMFKNKNETSSSIVLNSYSKYLCCVQGLQKKNRSQNLIFKLQTLKSLLPSKLACFHLPKLKKVKIICFKTVFSPFKDPEDRESKSFLLGSVKQGLIKPFSLSVFQFIQNAGSPEEKAK